MHSCFRHLLLSLADIVDQYLSLQSLRYFQMAIRSVPRRADFYKCLAQGGSVEKLDMELARWLVGLIAIVNRVSGFLADGGYGRV